MYNALSLHQSTSELTAALVRYRSITPSDGGLFEDLKTELERLGWRVHIVPFGDTLNMYARWGTRGPHLCFAGHVDVVPAGDITAWTTPPFEPVIRNGFLYGRGVADMKASIAAFLKAWSAFQAQPIHSTNASFSLLLTSDEEGPGLDGIPKMMPWMVERGEKPDVILIGEPTGDFVGEVLQVGRRGSLVTQLKILGKQGHIACPHLADNPLPRLMKCLTYLAHHSLDSGTDMFQASNLELTSIDTGNAVENLIPSQVTARFGIRFNVLHTGKDLINWVRESCAHYGGNHELTMRCSGEPFLTEDPHWITCVFKAVETITRKSPRYTTQGGTTDGRFLHQLAPVLELGMPETTIHQVNEHISVEDLMQLEGIYLQIFNNFFCQ